ncbi:DUF1444 domain-containing protein [Listeria monocytogenes]|uniref:DUF1444 domain-containing protein n=1 Tax=Listeria monocytogenes TaxID=1639 RepID=UPI001A8F0596|nr:DUF1444 domain-containing protein [Listeria monocytogenes]MBO0022916.1 DUF1444 domain-containing protein [Listeria monocytogenes]MBO0026883.1 DUF1444 domain-containing protein [Listeria monocytogenes]MBO0030705.1 DUF1444 domain-containing protein [Listeria monocytogenes]MBO0035647.1 DUF1444 domain-containing protein [Listeria monocytogenes]MBO0037516.1 DUF1444 domain-containing protein [Listeria monocytogenes]
MAKMTTLKMKERLEKELQAPNRQFSYNRDNDALTVVQSGKKVTLAIPQIIANYENDGDAAVEKIVYYVEEGFRAAAGNVELENNKANVYPVVCATSFPGETKAGEVLLTDDHTAETKIFYAVDLGKSYRFIEESMLKKAQLTHEEIREAAFNNLANLEIPLKKDSVNGNDFYFVRTNDGYDASRLLNEAFLREMREKLTGEMVLAVPHQDVLIIGDIQDNTGYDVLAHMTMDFFADGLVPITSLPFVYNNGKLEPIFIMAKNRLKE